MTTHDAASTALLATSPSTVPKGNRNLATQFCNVRARDEQMHRAKTLPSAQYLRHAAHRSGRNPISIAMESLKLRRGRGKLTLSEYVQYGVYDPALTEDERSRFLGKVLSRPITQCCCDFTWGMTTEDKWLCARILERSPVPMPPSLAVIDTSSRTYPDTRTIRTPNELRDFIVTYTREGGAGALFGKPNLGVFSLGAFLVLDGDRDRLHLQGEGDMDYETFMEHFIGDTPCLLQPRISNHPVLARWTDHLATVRVYLCIGERGTEIPYTVLKLPSQGNIADNFWRPGNLICALDRDTGTILKARTMDALGTTDHEVHPVTAAPLVGETLPMWDRVIDLARTCSPIFPRVRYQSMDIALTSGGGPMLIEINTGGSFTLPQYATGRGFLTEEVRAFFRECGYAKV